MMQTLVEAKYVGELRSDAMMQYLLVHPSLLSPPKYKLSREWEAFGILPCYQVVFNGYYKLNYFIEGYADLASLLPALPPDVFLQYVHNILSTVISLRAVGAMHPINLETSLDRIFIDEKDNSAHMIYLPVSDGYMEHMNTHYEQALKGELKAALWANKNLHSPLSAHLGELLARDDMPLEQIKAALVEQDPTPIRISQPEKPAAALPAPAPAQAAGPFVPSELEKAGVQAITASLSGEVEDTSKVSIQPEAPLYKPAPKPALPPEPAPAESTAAGTPPQPPALVLVGPKKDEITLGAQEVTLGRQPKKVDHAITYSRAISQVHCKISCAGGQYFVADLFSTNGTYVDGAMLEPESPVPLCAGSELKLGNIRFTVQAGKGAS